MFQEAYKDNKGKNFVLSAFSVMPPLGQLALAAVGDTQNEILKAMDLPNTDVAKEVFADITKHLKSIQGVELRLANRIYVSKHEELNSQYALTSRDIFNSDFKNIDFSLNAEAAKEINAWVEENTNKRIKDLISKDDLDSSTEVVLGKWKKAFSPESTKDNDFHVTKEKTIKVPMMKQTSDFKYGESTELDAKLLEMQYEGDQSSVLIVLPNQIEGINDLVEKLKDLSLLNKAIEKMSYNNVDVLLPKFKIETTTDLKDVLQRMNIVNLFTHNKARLDNLLKNRSMLNIDTAIQKAFIDVNEEGTEAAAANYFAATGAVGLLLPPIIRHIFKADHPFVFFLMEGNNVLFNGVYQS